MITWLSKEKKKEITENKINKSLKILSGENSIEQKAKAFIVLMQLSYVRVHKLINKGNNYNDQKQIKKFSDTLSYQVVAKINEMEGIYG